MQNDLKALIDACNAVIADGINDGDDAQAIVGRAKFDALAMAVLPFQKPYIDREGFRMDVPTYNGGHPNFGREGSNLAEYGEPYTPMLIQPCEGVRLIMGPVILDGDTHTPEYGGDILLEHQHDGWAVFVHSLGGDPECVILMPDDKTKPLRIEDCGGELIHEVERG